MTEAPQIRPTSSIAMSFGASLVGLGIILNLISRMFDGFAQGLFLGAGIMFILIGVFTLSGPLRRRLSGAEPTEQDDTWLPSRDGER